MIILILGKLSPLKVRQVEIMPTVSVIIPAYNEAKHIGKKIENTLALDYPKDKIEILVGSDGSTDETPLLLEKYVNNRIQVQNFKKNRGKTAVQNDLVWQSKGEIIVFTDAASFLHCDAIKKIVSNFADDRVGCVAGKMYFVDTDSNITSQSQGIYWRYESKIRELESNLGSVIGVDGPLYALRRELYVPLNHNIISDLIVPLLVLEQDKKVVLETGAIVEEIPTYKSSQEFTTRRRIVLRALIGLSINTQLFNPFKYTMLSFQIIFHKVLRWSMGLLVILNFLACLALSTYPFFKVVTILYIIFFIFAGLGWLAELLGKKNRVLSIPYYFILVNFAATIGIIDFIRRKQATTWQTVRDKGER